MKRLTTERAKKLTAEAKNLPRRRAFRLPMRSAILTVLQPEEFTMYDRRVRDSIEAFHNLGTWASYLDLTGSCHLTFGRVYPRLEV